MKVITSGNSRTLEELGLHNLGNVYWNATTPQLYEEVIHRHEAISPITALWSCAPDSTPDVRLTTSLL